MGIAPETPVSVSTVAVAEPGSRASGARILLISGSTRPESTNTAALRTLADIAAPDIAAELFTDLVDIPAFVPGDEQSPPAVAALRTRLAAADAVVFCTPEYAGLIPGSLKNLLEWTVGTADLHEKPVAWISVAAPGRGEGAVASLRTVLGYVGAVEIESACTRITVLGTMIGPHGTVADTVVREALTASVAAIGGYLSTATSSRQL